MALLIEDRVKETTTSTGTGPVVLAGALTSYKRFADVCTVGTDVLAAIVAVDASGQPLGEWEAGLYTYSATNTLTRTTVYSSSNNDLPVNFSAGTKHVYIDLLANYIKQFATSTPDTAVMPFGLDPTLFTSVKFQDEFNGLALDTTKWDTKLAWEAPPSVNNYRIDAGSLQVWPQRDTSGAWISRHFPALFYQIYGYYEVEAQLPLGAGIVPGFYLTSHDLTTETPKVAVAETYGAAPWQADAEFIDWKSIVYNLTATGEIGSVRGSAQFTAQNLSTTFHKYGVLWEPSGFTFYIDGIQVGSKVATTVYTNRMYLVLALSAGAAGSLAGEPTPATTPEGVTNPMKVNYVRIWQLVNAPAGSDNPPPATGGNTTTGTAPVGQDPSLWELTFEDHFLGTTLDRTKWNRGVYYDGSTPGTFKVENSNLVMCYQDPFKRANCTIDTDPQGWDIQGPGFQQTYGFFEARIKLPYGQNVFPAFWIFRHDQREFDIMENFGGSGATWMTSDFHPINAAWTVHKSLSDTGLGTAALHNNWYLVNNGSGQMPGSFYYPWLAANVVDLSNDYHVYACEWGAGFIRFFFDGKVIKDKNGGGDPFTYRMTEFNGFPMYMMLDFWMEGTSAGTCPRGFGPWEMRVDYVRAWKRR